MQNSQSPLAPRYRHLRAVDVEELEEAQPEKRRRYVQLAAGSFSAELVELRTPGFQVFRERVEVGVRVEAVPPPDLVPFAVTLAIRGGAHFCGVDLGPNAFVQASGGGWEFRGLRAIDYVCCAFDRDRFEQAALDLTGRPARAEWFLSRVRPGSSEAGSALGRRLLRLLSDAESLSTRISHEASRRLEAELVQQTLAVLCLGDDEPGVAPAWRRSRAVRRALEFLDAGAEPTPTIPELCRFAGVSQRTLEYAFREQLGVPPVRYLKLLRLDRARRRLRRASREEASVMSIALACGFTELGRFAGEYRSFFGESPSETLRRD